MEERDQLPTLLALINIMLLQMKYTWGLLHFEGRLRCNTLLICYSVMIPLAYQSWGCLTQASTEL